MTTPNPHSSSSSAADTSTAGPRDVATSIWASYPIERLLPELREHTCAAESPVTLENEVNPLFARDQFPKSFDYDALLPALQFASLLIETPEIMDYWYAAFLSEPREVEYADRDAPYKAIFRKGSPLSKEEVEQVKACFLALAANVNFEPVDLDNGGLAATLCTYDSLNSEPSLSEKATWLGHRSTIFVNEVAHRPVINAMIASVTDPSPKNSQRLAVAYFDLAKAIVHEVAHAVHNARWGPPEAAKYAFETQLLCEDGWDWEATVFGGLIEVQNQDPDRIRMAEWPSCYKAEFYAKQSLLGTAVLAPWEYVRSESDMLWRVSPAFIANMFRKEFWEDVGSSGGAAALKPPRLLGTRLARMYPATKQCCSCDDCETLEEFVLRQNRRGNGPMLETGSLMEEVRQNAAVKAIMKDGNSEHEDDGGVDRLVAATSTQLTIQPPRTLSTTPSLCFTANAFIPWPYGPDPDDPRNDQLHTYALPPGYKSLLDGSVVHSEHFQTLAAWENEQSGKPECFVAHFRAPEDRWTVPVQKQAMLVELLVRFAGMSREEIRGLSTPELCKIVRERDDREEILGWCEKEARVKLNVYV